MRKLLLASLLIFGFLQQGIAQRFDYDHSSKVFIGLNVGYAWHTSDVRNVRHRFPLGAGFTLGGTFNRDYGKFFTYDLYFRYLFGNWYGQDTDTTQAIQDNFAVNNLYNTLGYAVQNFKATQHNLDLEFAVHFNRVKESTGLDPYIFGGVGFTFTRTRGDLLNTKNSLNEGTIYPYNENQTGDLISKNYATPLDKNSSGEPYEGFEANFLPSVGVGIGYYFSSNFSIGLEHRTTFFNGDYFDGTHLNQDGQPSKIKNDLYHYTSIYFKWYLKAGGDKKMSSPNETSTPPVNPVIPNPNYIEEPVVNQQPRRKTPPVINFTNPSESPFTITQASMTIRAEVKHVNSGNNLTFTQDGEVHETFIFNPKDDIFESTVSLNVGKNIFKLTGFNSDGSDDDEAVVIYEKSTPQNTYLPTVNIVDPVNSPFNVNQLNYVVKAAIHNVKARNLLKVTFNDEPFYNFSFNENGDINFSANLNLKVGVNTLKIIGTNDVGRAEDKTALIYTRAPSEETGYPPVVKITIPNKKPFTTSKTEVGVVAKIGNIQNNQQVEVVINGVSTTNFNYNRETKMVQFNAGLSTGYNNIKVKAQNPYGVSEDNMQIIYQSGYDPNGSNLPPLVSITSPNVNPYSAQEPVQPISAKVDHVDSEQQIEVKVNGIQTTNFTFNKSTGNVQLNANLSEGSNIISIKATNSFGSDSDLSQVIYHQKIVIGNPPKVMIITPDKNPFTTSHKTEKVVATVANVSEKAQIKVEINGVSTSNFDFDSTSKQVQVNVKLSLGSNKVKVSATNNFGSASDETQILMTMNVKPKANVDIKLPLCNGPTMVFMTPEHSVVTVNNESFEVITKLNNIQNKNQIEVFLNNRKMTNFSYDTSTKILKHTIHLKEEKSIYKIRLTNECSSKEGEITLNYEAPVCGVDITLDNSDFCLSKAGGVIERNGLLINASFHYEGTAKSLYFKAENGGLVKVNGVDYPLVKGVYYHFIGILTVHLSKVNNQWHVCVESARNPLFGSDASRPPYPCENGIGDNSGKGLEEPATSKEIVKPQIITHPSKTTEPNQDSKENDIHMPIEEPSKPAIRNDKNPRKHTGGK